MRGSAWPSPSKGRGPLCILHSLNCTLNINAVPPSRARRCFCASVSFSSLQISCANRFLRRPAAVGPHTAHGRCNRQVRRSVDTIVVAKTALGLGALASMSVDKSVADGTQVRHCSHSACRGHSKTQHRQAQAGRQGGIESKDASMHRRL